MIRVDWGGTHMSMARGIAIAAVGLLLPLAGVQAGGREDFHETAKKSIENHAGWDEDDSTKRSSPFRTALKQKVKERRNQGKGTPDSIVFDPPELFADPDGLDDETGEPIGWGPGTCEDRKRCPTRGYVVKYRAVTKLKYRGPADVHDGKGGGKPEWPLLIVTGNPDGTPDTVNKTQEYKDFVAAQAAAMDPPRVAWKVDPNDPSDPGEYEFGQEPQEEEVTEEITFTFKEEDLAQGEAFFRDLSGAMAAGDLGAEQAILMGFTYQGPNIDYTIGSKKRVCLFGCFYLWNIRAGFALDFGLGLRLPAISRLNGPDTLIAGETVDFQSMMTAGDWNDSTYTENGVRAYGGNEFVAEFEFFAGAKVQILGVDVCPWCKYVEIDENYSKSFATPFGAGDRSLTDSLSVNVPITDLNFGIVALEVGLKVTPTITSRDIDAFSGDQEVSHSASGQWSTFPVKGCIENPADTLPNGERWQTVSLDEYRYNFTDFTLTLGAYLDFSVAGYGVWKPQFDFLSLNLSGALGSLGLYLPDHLSCNFAFQCEQRPVNQVSVQSRLFDRSPPLTDLSLAGVPGKNGWWTSNVTGTMTPADMPLGCGAGVGSSWWGLANPPETSGSPFVLSDERIMTAFWQSIDRDGNLEGVNQREVKIDKTPPTVSGAATAPPNPRNWYREDVTIHFVATDATSLVASLTPDAVLSADGRGQEFTGTAEDHAGLRSQYTVTGINIDKTPPSVTITVPSASGIYKNTDTFVLTWIAEDGLSGILAQGGTLDGENRDNGSPVELIFLGGGYHVVHAFAKDNADNVREAQVTFLVDVDIDGLLAAVKLACTKAWVTKAGICNSLTAKVLEAKTSLDAGLKEDARGQLNAFLNELDAQQGKSILDPGYRLLRTNGIYVLVRYGLVPLRAAVSTETWTASPCPDSLPPSTVNLAARGVPDSGQTRACAALGWNAPSDLRLRPDPVTGFCVPVAEAAASYDIRWSDSPILTDADFNAAAPLPGAPAPVAPGTPQSFFFCAPQRSSFYVALRSTDPEGNASSFSAATVQRDRDRPGAEIPSVPGNGRVNGIRERVTELGLSVAAITEASVKLELALPAPGHVRVAVFDIAGRRMGTLVNADLPAGVHPLTWDAGGVSRGLYFVRIWFDGGAQTRRVVLMR